MPDAPPTTPALPPELDWTARVPVEHADSAGADAQNAMTRYKAAHKGVNNLIRQLTLFPAAIDAETAIGLLPHAATHLPPHLVEAARLRAAAVCGCGYCVGWHTRFAENTGYVEADALLIADAARLDLGQLDADTQMVVRVAHELSSGPLSESLFNAAKVQLGELATVELIAIAAAQNYTSRMGAALKTPFEPAYARMLARKNR
ncbi:MAG: carboxymuconolactone decarboxylase family protein [bacterium]